MRKKSINLYFNNDVDVKLKFKEIKKLGYDEFFTDSDDNRESLTVAEQVEYAKSLGLKCTMIHCTYYEPELNSFWLDDKMGEKVLKDYLSQIKKCAGLTENFVVHLCGDYGSQTTEIGLKRIKKLLSACKRYGMNLCIENLYSYEQIPYVFKNIKHSNLKICLDTGHRNFLTPKFDILEEFGEHIGVLHLHDNDGSDDFHDYPLTGSVDWKKFSADIKKYPNLVFSAEVKYPNVDYKQTLKETYKSLCKLEKMSEK